MCRWSQLPTTHSSPRYPLVRTSWYVQRMIRLPAVFNDTPFPVASSEISPSSSSNAIFSGEQSSLIFQMYRCSELSTPMKTNSGCPSPSTSCGYAASALTQERFSPRFATTREPISVMVLISIPVESYDTPDVRLSALQTRMKWTRQSLCSTMVDANAISVSGRNFSSFSDPLSLMMWDAIPLMPLLSFFQAL